MADNSVIQIPRVIELGKNGPIPEALLHRLDIDLDQLQILALSIGRVARNLIGDEEDVNNRDAILSSIDAMAYRIGRMLEPWTGTGYFGDAKERQVKISEVEEVAHA